MGFASKVAFLSRSAWSDKIRGSWPDNLPVAKHRQYDLPTIKKWLDVFLFRFFRSVNSSVRAFRMVLRSARADRFRAAIGAHRLEAAAWLEELRRNVPTPNNGG